MSLGGEDPLEKETAVHSSILAWEIPWTEEPFRLQSMKLQRVRHNLATKQQLAHRKEQASGSQWGFPGGSVGKEFTCDERDRGSIPGSGRSPGEENGSPLQYSCPRTPRDRGAW